MTNKKEPISICFATDDNYAIHCAVAIASVLENSKHNDSYDFYVIDGGISSKNKTIILNLANWKDCKIKFLPIDKKMFADSFVDYHFTQAIYYRFLIPKLIKTDKVIYLDSDLLVRKDISEFFRTNIENHYVGAIEDILPDEQVKRLAKKGLKIKSGHYYNSGVLLINCDKWRNEKITETLINSMIENKDKILWPDQDILNYCLQDKIKPIDKTWNFQVSPFHHQRLTEEEIEGSSIIHFISEDKPWKPDSKQVHKEEYPKYLMLVQNAQKLAKIN